MTQLQRLVLTFKPGELVMHVLYGGADPDGPRPNTKARTRVVTDLARSGLRDALEGLQGDVTICGTSGFTQREDLLSLPRPDELREAAS
jgi:hypothetical protein